MEYKFNFKTEEEKQQIIDNNKNLTLIKQAYHLDECYLIFTDEEIIYDLTDIEIVANKISILTEENEKLKQELALTQDAVNEILFMMMNMEGK